VLLGEGDLALPEVIEVLEQRPHPLTPTPLGEGETYLPVFPSPTGEGTEG